MRICFLSDPRYLHLQRWARFFAERGHEVQVVGGLGADLSIMPGVGVYSLDIAAFTGPWVLRTTLALSRLLRRLRPDILHMHYLGPLLAPLLLRFRPFLVTVWGADILGARGFATESHRFRMQKRLLLRRAETVLAPSRFLAAATCRYAGLPANRVAVFPWGVDLAQFQPVSRVPAPADAAAPVVLGFVKHLEPKYGAEYLLRAVPAIRRGHPQTRVLMLGDGSLRPQLEALARSLGIADAVTFQGRVPHHDVPRHMGVMDVFVMPSIHESESFGIAAVEAQAMGIPVIASRIGGVPEAVIDGRTGMLVPPGDPEALARAIVRLLDDPPRRAAMGEEGRRFTARWYDWRANATRVEGLYDDLVARARNGGDR